MPYLGMTDKQLQEILAVLNEIKAEIKQLAENTKPVGRLRRGFEIVGLIATISGLAGFLETVIRWIGAFWR
ncbi:MAG: hypothetical protein Ta2A_19430 [Treponemataceae bacterium]|nr:MAG: hypothetical protein Ta2A_19430 [Treponemataceae bacterium]